MFMHKTLVGMIEELEAQVKKLDCDKDRLKELNLSAGERIDGLRKDIEFSKRTQNLAIEEARNTLRKEMQKSLIESDLKRVKAESALEAYEKMDTKTEREHQRKMLEKAIEGLSKDTKLNLIKG